MTEEFIEHYGIKGMRWGVRNERGEGGRKSRSEYRSEKRAIKKAAKSEKKIKKARKTGNMKGLTLDELRDLNNRLDFEKRTRDLISSVDSNRKFSSFKGKADKTSDRGFKGKADKRISDKILIKQGKDLANGLVKETIKATGKKGGKRAADNILESWGIDLIDKVTTSKKVKEERAKKKK